MRAQSPADRCKNCGKCGKGLEFCTKLLSCRSIIDLGYFENSDLLFVCQYGCLKHRNSIKEENLRSDFLAFIQ